jgi:hypothetical protein
MVRMVKEIASLMVLGIIAVVFVAVFVRLRGTPSRADDRQILYDEASSVVLPRPFGFQLGSNVSLSRTKLLPDMLVLRGPINLDISLAAITSVVLARRWFSQGVRVVTTDDRAREIFLFLPRSREFVALIERQRREMKLAAST